MASHCNCVDWVATFESNQGFDPFTPSYADLCAADPTCAECSEWVSFCNRCDELGENKLKDLDKATLANLGDGDDSMWAHVCFIYVATFVVIAILSRFNEDAVALRLRHQVRPQRAMAVHLRCPAS